MEINGWLFALAVAYLIIRNGWKYLLLWRLKSMGAGLSDKLKGVLPHGNDDGA